MKIKMVFILCVFFSSCLSIQEFLTKDFTAATATIVYRSMLSCMAKSQTDRHDFRSCLVNWRHHTKFLFDRVCDDFSIKNKEEKQLLEKEIDSGIRKAIESEMIDEINERSLNVD